MFIVTYNTANLAAQGSKRTVLSNCPRRIIALARYSACSNAQVMSKLHCFAWPKNVHKMYKVILSDWPLLATERAGTHVSCDSHASRLYSRHSMEQAYIKQDLRSATTWTAKPQLSTTRESTKATPRKNLLI